MLTAFVVSRLRVLISSKRRQTNSFRRSNTTVRLCNVGRHFIYGWCDFCFYDQRRQTICTCCWTNNDCRGIHTANKTLLIAVEMLVSFASVTTSFFCSTSVNITPTLHILQLMFLMFAINRRIKHNSHPTKWQQWRITKGVRATKCRVD